MQYQKTKPMHTATVYSQLIKQTHLRLELLSPAAYLSGPYSNYFISRPLLICTPIYTKYMSKINTISRTIERLQPDKDIQPLSEFPAKAASMIEKIKAEHRPLVITQRGKSSAVLLDVSDYEKMVDTIELLQEVSQARQELEDGKGVPHDEVISSLKTLKTAQMKIIWSPTSHKNIDDIVDYISADKIDAALALV